MEQPSQRQLTWRWRVIEAVVVAVARSMRWRIDIHGLHHVAAQRGAVLAFNHHSYWDFVMVAWGVVRTLRRPVRFLAKREVWSSPWSGWVVRWGDAVPVDRSSPEARDRAYAAAVAALRAGDLVAVAPEQTISQSFELLPFRTGAVRMAQQAGVPIIPVLGWGTQRFATKGRRMRPVFRLPVLVEYGEPVEVGPDEDPVAVTERLQEGMRTRLHDLQVRYPDEPAPGDDWWLPARLGGGAPRHEDVLAAHERRIAGWDGGGDRASS